MCVELYVSSHTARGRQKADDTRTQTGDLERESERERELAIDGARLSRRRRGRRLRVACAQLNFRSRREKNFFFPPRPL